MPARSLAPAYAGCSDQCAGAFVVGRPCARTSRSSSSGMVSVLRQICGARRSSR